MSLMRTTYGGSIATITSNCFMMMRMKKSSNCCFLGLSETKKSASSGFILLRLKNKKSKCGGNKIKFLLE